MKITLKRPQIDFIGSPDQFPAYIAGVGAGKSTALIAKALFHLKESPSNLGVIVRKNYTDLRNSTIKDFETYTGLRVNESTHEVRFPNGSSLLFIHGDILDSLKNINCGFFGIEQAEEFTDDTTWQFLKMRLRRQCKFRTGSIIGNTHGHNWIWEIYKRQIPPKNHELIEATTYDFKDILPPDYIENLESLPKKLFNRYVLNSWEITEGLVYDEFLDSKHVIEPHEIPETWEKGFVLDHGFRNPTAGLWYAIDHDGNITLYDEHYETEKPVSYHAEQIKKRNIFQGLADPSIFNKTQSRADYIFSIADEYRDFGIHLSPALREEEFAAIGRVNEFFKAGRIRVFKSLVNTIREFSSWKWKEVRPGYGLNLPEEPEDKGNHLCLAGSTEIVTRDGIERIGELEGKIFEVLTPLGFKLAQCVKTGVQPTLTLTLDDGVTIQGTKDHPLLSTQGWDRMEYIEQGDLLYGPQNHLGYDSRVKQIAVLLGRYSLLPKGRKTWLPEVPCALASSERVGVGQRQDTIRNMYSPQGPQQEKQFSFQSGSHESEGPYFSPYAIRGTKVHGPVSSQESNFGGTKVAPLESWAGMAQESLDGNSVKASSEYLSMPCLSKTISIERLSDKMQNQILSSELQGEVLPSKRVVEKRKAESSGSSGSSGSSEVSEVYNLEVLDAHCFILPNGVVSHNCDDLKYLIASRFPKSTLTGEKPLPRYHAPIDKDIEALLENA